MLTIFRSLSEMCFSELMLVYQEGNLENATELYSALDLNEAIIQAEQDFYTYLKDCFFASKEAFYAVWQENGRYISALRMEPYRDGFLLEALETRSDFRKRGYAKKLILEVSSCVSAPIYSHVNKNNDPSLATHYSVGFSCISESATYIDGSVSYRAYTLCLNNQNK